MIRKAAIVGLSSLLIWTPAGAEKTASELCADELPRPGRIMYKRTAPKIEPDSNIAEVMRDRIPYLVMTGRIDRSDAQENAEPVGRCLWLIHNTPPAAAASPE